MKQDVKSQDLSLKLDLAGFKKHLATTTTLSSPAIAQGALQFSSTHSNIAVHTCDIIEKRHFSSTAELDACLSVNVLFKGCVRYRLGEHNHEYAATNNIPTVIVNAINQSEIFTRFMTPNQRVKKLNLSFNKQWLIDHCALPTDLNLFEDLFTQCNQVAVWQANERITHLASTIIENVDDKSLSNQLLTDRIAIEILQLILVELKKIMKVQRTPANTMRENHNSNNLLARVNELLDQKLSLEQIAQELAMSVSTLQRKFKSLYHITVIEHHRRKKLNQSRKHLAIDGLSIGETAYLAGYKHPSNFNHAFKQQFNLTPTEFLKQHQHCE